MYITLNKRKLEKVPLHNNNNNNSDTYAVKFALAAAVLVCVSVKQKCFQPIPEVVSDTSADCR